MAPASDAPAGPARSLFATPELSARLPTFLGAALIIGSMVVSRYGTDALGPWLIPAGAVSLAVGFGRYARSRHPTEPWLGQLVLMGVAAKVIASYIRYFTLLVEYKGKGDATGYDEYGRMFASAWMGDGVARELTDLRKTNFLRWFTGVVYYTFGSNLLTGFFVFGLIAILGSYFWYRATVDAVPFIDRRLYLMLVMFVPSIVFWPSAIGKEALMQLGIGTLALGIARLFRARLVSGLVICSAGGWLIWVVRPHLLAMVALSGGAGYAIGRVRKRDGSAGSVLTRPAGLIIVGFLVFFTLTQGAQFLEIEEISVSGVEEELNQQTDSTAQGGSEFDDGGNSLSPLSPITGFVTVILRPFPWETETALQLLASAESVALAGFMVVRRRSIRVAITRARREPFLLFCLILTAVYATAFSSFANFGLLTRQRSLVLPALYVLLAVNADAIRRRSDDAVASPARPEAASARG